MEQSEGVMTTTETLTGLLKPDGTLELDEAPRLPAGRVEVVLHLLHAPDSCVEDWWGYLQRARLRRRPHASARGPQIEAERETFREEGDQRGDINRPTEEAQAAEKPEHEAYLDSVILVFGPF